MQTNHTPHGHPIGYYQLARGLGMLFIIAGHSITPFFDKQAAMTAQTWFSGAGSVFGGGVMAMFFMISGAGLARNAGIGMRGVLRAQWQYLIKPYTLSAAAILLCKILLAILRARPFSENGGELVLTFLLGLNAEGGGTFFGFPVDSVGVFWFLLALGGGNVLVYFIGQIQKPYLRLTAAVLCMLAGCVLGTLSPYWVFCLPLSLIAAGYLYAGQTVGQYALAEPETRIPWYAHLCMGAVIVVSFARGAVNLVSCEWRLGMLDLAATVFVGFYLLRLYARLARYLPERGGGIFLGFAENVGRYSMQILCIHAFEKMLFPWYRLGDPGYRLNDLLPETPVLCAALCFVGRMVLIFGILWLAETVRRWGRRGWRIGWN